MVLIKENITKAMTMLGDLLMNCMEKETVVRVHGNINGVTIRNSATLDEFDIDYDGLYLVLGWFEINVDKELLSISHDEDTNSVHIEFENGELDLDLGEDYNLE